MKSERSAVRGAIDGCLSVLGVVIGAFGSDPSLLLSAALSGNFANGMSNLLAAFSSETVLRSTRIGKLERSLLVDLTGTELDREARSGARREAAADALATLIGGMVPIAPFLIFQGVAALGISIVGSLLLMLIVGAWTGQASREGMLLSALKLVVLAILTVLACLVIHIVVAPGVPFS